MICKPLFSLFNWTKRFGNEAFLLAGVRFVMDEEIHEELLFTKTLVTDAIGESKYNVLNYFLTEDRVNSNVISVGTDETPAIVR